MAKCHTHKWTLEVPGSPLLSLFLTLSWLSGIWVFLGRYLRPPSRCWSAHGHLDIPLDTRRRRDLGGRRGLVSPVGPSCSQQAFFSTASFECCLHATEDAENASVKSSSQLSLPCYPYHPPHEKLNDSVAVVFFTIEQNWYG